MSAQQRLMAAMSEISERSFYAGWMKNLEFDLWRAICEGPRRYGDAAITSDDIKRLASLSMECGGWIVWDGDEEKFVSTSEWEKIYALFTAGDAHR